MRFWMTAIIVVATSICAQAGQPARYRVLSDDRYDTRRVVAIELSERTFASRLEQIADGQKSKDAKAYERTVINFYLPSMNLGDGSWATVSYTPQRYTSIHGITREEQLALIQKVRLDKRERIGSWLASSTAIAGEVTIFRKDGKLYVEWSLRNGVKSTKEVSRTRTWRGRRFDIKSGAQTYFLVNGKNDLEIRDVKGLVATGELIQPNNNTRLQTALIRSKSRLGASPHVIIHQTQNATIKTALPSAGTQGSDPRVSDPYDATNAVDTPPHAPPYLEDRGDLPPVAIAKPRVTNEARKPKPSKRVKNNAQDVFMANMMR